jgi:DNA-binding protein
MFFEVNQMKVDENVVFVGKKPVTNYVLAIVSLFNQGHDEVIIKSRGRNNAKALDVLRVTKDKFFPSVKYEIEIESESDQNGKPVTSLTIKVMKG